MKRILDLDAVFFEKNSRENIELISASLQGNGFCELPNELKEFYLLTDGIIYKEYEIFGLSDHAREIKFYTLLNIIDYNKKFVSMDLKNKFIFGSYRDCFLMYFKEKNIYAFVNKINLKISRKFDSLNLLLEEIVK